MGLFWVVIGNGKSEFSPPGLKRFIPGVPNGGMRFELKVVSQQELENKHKNSSDYFLKSLKFESSMTHKGHFNKSIKKGGSKPMVIFRDFPYDSVLFLGW